MFNQKNSLVIAVLVG